MPGRVEEPQEGAPPLRLPAEGVLREAAAARTRLIEALADLDDAVGEAYLQAAESGGGGGGGGDRAEALAAALGLPSAAQARLGLDPACPGLTPGDLRCARVHVCVCHGEPAAATLAASAPPLTFTAGPRFAG